VKPPTVRLSINGQSRELAAVPPDERLLDTIRWRVGLKGTKEGCRTGECGACTVLREGKGALSCLVLTHDADGATITTIEGVGSDPVGAQVRTAFETAGALQCGYCTPGFVMALTGLLRERGRGAPIEEILEDLGGNLCRCTGYSTIVRAARSAREALP
jgi:aerobic carbon-monoxide dehydrogenase small subunit